MGCGAVLRGETPRMMRRLDNKTPKKRENSPDAQRMSQREGEHKRWRMAERLCEKQQDESSCT